jgi:SAM-dependent methyltransferase
LGDAWASASATAAGEGTLAAMNDRPPGSSSVQQRGYWWYRARSGLLQAALEPYLDGPARILDVGSADGPSVGWLRGGLRVEIDTDPRGLSPGTGVCGSALALPFRDEAFDVVGAFDVLEHCASEDDAMRELSRVLAVGGRLLMSVPAYEWAWTDHDVRAGHFRRYTRPRLRAAARRGGLSVERCTYAFASVFPFFVAERVARRLRADTGSDEGSLPAVSPSVERILLRLCELDRRALQRRRDLPFGSSILLAAVKAAD